MTNRTTHAREPSVVSFPQIAPELPRPTPQFRRNAWRHFQRALDPLAPPKPLPAHRQQH